jgi:hypothetical protein
MGEIALRDLERPVHIFAFAHPELSSDVPLIPVEDASTRKIPVSLTPFLGRDSEIAGVVAQVVTEVLRELLALQFFGATDGPGSAA